MRRISRSFARQKATILSRSWFSISAKRKATAKSPLGKLQKRITCARHSTVSNVLPSSHNTRATRSPISRFPGTGRRIPLALRLTLVCSVNEVHPGWFRSKTEIIEFDSGIYAEKFAFLQGNSRRLWSDQKIRWPKNGMDAGDQSIIPSLGGKKGSGILLGG